MDAVSTETVNSSPENGLVAAVAPKPGAPLNNQNAGTHFLRSSGWPLGTERERRAVAAYGKCLREAVMAGGGTLDIVTAGLVQTAQRWERHALLAARWLRREHEQLTPDQRLSFSRETARASAERDKAVAMLGIRSERDIDPWLEWDKQVAQERTGGQP